VYYGEVLEMMPPRQGAKISAWGLPTADPFSEEHAVSNHHATAYQEALAEHAGTLPAQRPLALLATSTVDVPHLVLLLSELADLDAAAAEVVAREARRVSAGLLRLGDAALALCAREMGHDPESWRDAAIARASAVLCDAAPDDDGDQLGLAALEVDHASRCLASAIMADDRLALAGHLVEAQAGWLCSYVRVGSASPAYV
jgi:hypothetical protein